jgi:hypothetical protein
VHSVSHQRVSLKRENEREPGETQHALRCNLNKNFALPKPLALARAAKRIMSPVQIGSHRNPYGQIEQARIQLWCDVTATAASNGRARGTTPSSNRPWVAGFFDWG